MRRRELLLVALIPVIFTMRSVAMECDRDCATQCTNINDPELLLPDLVSAIPSEVRVTRQGSHRVVLFTSSAANIGEGPLILHGKTVQGPNGPTSVAVQEIFKRDGSSCVRDAGTFEFHPSHHHFHVDNFASYQLRKDDPYTGENVAESTKVSFCLLDIAQLRGFQEPRVVQSDCLNQEGTQGISAGFADVYDWYLPGQLIDLDADPEHPVPGGTYFLVNVVNADGLLWEKDDATNDNLGWATVRVTASRVGPVTPPTPTSIPTVVPTAVPTAVPTVVPTAVPTAIPTAQPSPQPTQTPSAGGLRHSPHAPHVPHDPFLGPRPRLPHRPHAPHGSLH